MNNDLSVRLNHKIRAIDVRLISPLGKNLGIIKTSEAISLAQKFNLDLVEISPNANPPVCRIMDYNKYVYEMEKNGNPEKANIIKIKEIEFSPRIESNDLLIKIKHATEFLQDGYKVKIRLKFRGREIAHPELGFDIINQVIKHLESVGTLESPPKLSGKQINLTLSPIKGNIHK